MFFSYNETAIPALSFKSNITLLNNCLFSQAVSSSQTTYLRVLFFYFLIYILASINVSLKFLLTKTIKIFATNQNGMPETFVLPYGILLQHIECNIMTT